MHYVKRVYDGVYMTSKITNPWQEILFNMYFNLDITNKEQEIKNYRPLKTNDVSIHELVHSLLTKQ